MSAESIEDLIPVYQTPSLHTRAHVSHPALLVSRRSRREGSVFGCYPSRWWCHRKGEISMISSSWYDAIQTIERMNWSNWVEVRISSVYRLCVSFYVHLSWQLFYFVVDISGFCFLFSCQTLVVKSGSLTFNSASLLSVREPWFFAERAVKNTIMDMLMQ